MWQPTVGDTFKELISKLLHNEVSKLSPAETDVYEHRLFTGKENTWKVPDDLPSK
jgi:hypothetical protein